MQNKEVNNNREAVNNKVSKLKGLGSTRREIWKGRLRNRSI
jgi:hypothetical protein